MAALTKLMQQPPYKPCDSQVLCKLTVLLIYSYEIADFIFELFALLFTVRFVWETLLKKGYLLHELVRANPFLRLLVCSHFAGYLLHQSYLALNIGRMRKLFELFINNALNHSRSDERKLIIGSARTLYVRQLSEKLRDCRL